MAMSDKGGRTSDLFVEIVLDPAVVAPGEFFTMTARVGNLGPDPARSLLSVRQFQTADGSFIYPPIEGTDIEAALPCRPGSIFQPPPGDPFGFWNTPELMPSDVLVCEFSFQLLDTNLDEVEIGIMVGSTGAFPTTDPNDSNDLSVQTLTVAGAQVPIEVPILGGWIAKSVLIGLLAGLAIVKLRARKA